MKKTVLCGALLLSSAAAMASPGFNPGIMNDIQGFQGFNTHSLNSYKEQRFKFEEINDAKDLKEQKEKLNKEQTGSEVVSDPAMKKIFDKRSSTEDVKFIEEDGQIKIEGVEVPKDSAEQ